MAQKHIGSGWKWWMVLLLVLVMNVGGLAFGQATTEWISVSYDTLSSAYHSNHPGITSDGRYVSFGSDARDIIVGDNNNYSDVFVYDRELDEFELVSVSSGGTQGNGVSFTNRISPDGRYVVFVSNATNLVAGDTNSMWDIFVHDRETGNTERVSVSTAVTQANSHCWYPWISEGGRYVVFESYASNLVAGDTNGYSDVFLRDRELNTTTRISVSADGTQGNGNSCGAVISADGDYVSFTSGSSNLIDCDTNGVADVFVVQLSTGTVRRISVPSGGCSEANGASDIFARMSMNSRYVTFISSATNLVPDDTNGHADIFVHDLVSGYTERVSVASDGTQANETSYHPSVSLDGRFVVFGSAATNLVPNDTNGYVDVFLRDRLEGTTIRISEADDGTQGNNHSNTTFMAQGVPYAAYVSLASTIVFGDTNGRRDIFLYGPFDE